MGISERIKEEMRNRKVSVSTLALETGISASYLYDLLKGDRRWNIDSLGKTLSALRLKIEISSDEKQQE